MKECVYNYFFVLEIHEIFEMGVEWMFEICGIFPKKERDDKKSSFIFD